MFFIVALLALSVVPTSCRQREVRIGSKSFTESVVLGELLSERARILGFTTQHFQQLGGTRLVFDALVAREIDAYPEYTGTIDQEILGGKVATMEARRQMLAEQGVAISEPIGFNNTYALGMLKSRAEDLGVETISDLNRHPELRFGFSNEFMDREDGWEPLKTRYALRPAEARGLDHDIAYRQLTQGLIDVMDVYSTDAKIKKFDLKVLEDDRQFFPRYDAVVLYRLDWKELDSGRRADLARAWHRLAFPDTSEQETASRLNERQIIALNDAVEFGEQTERGVAQEFLMKQLGLPVKLETEPSWLVKILYRSGEHLDLVRRSLFPAIVVGVLLGIVSFYFRRFGHLVLGFVGIIQTIPGLALLVLVMPLVSWTGFSTVGVGSITVVVALFLYSLLPIVASTYSGLTSIDRDLIESANSIGMTTRDRLMKIEIPLAMPELLSGIRTAAVMNVGFATLGALIGAGGYGQPILTGIRLNDQWLIWQGALPAALLAIGVLGLFHLLGNWLIPRGLQLSTGIRSSS